MRPVTQLPRHSQNEEVQRYEDILIEPYTGLLDGDNSGPHHQGGPAWPDWDAKPASRHHVAQVPVDHFPEQLGPVERTVTEPIAWGGPVVPIYGHQVAEFSQRLLQTLEEAPDRRIAFTGWDRHRVVSPLTAPVFFWWILEWLGVGFDRFMWIDKRVTAADLVIAPQSEQWHGPGPGREDLDRLDRLVVRRLGTVQQEGTIYVSRSAQMGRFAGEAAIEAAMRAVGATILRPEELALPDQLRALAAADRLIFAEGSALHTAQLLGRSLGDVVVLARRPGLRLARESLAPRARSLRYVDAVAGVICGLTPNGNPWQPAGLTALDFDRLVDELVAVAPDIARRLPLARLRAARDEDVLAWMGEMTAHPWSQSVASREHLLGTLNGSGLGHLASQARAILEGGAGKVAAEQAARSAAAAQVAAAVAATAAAPTSPGTSLPVAMRLVRDSGKFDPVWYASHNMDVATGELDPLLHYVLVGYRENRQPGPDFDVMQYLARHPDVANSGENPLVHYTRAEQRAASG